MKYYPTLEDLQKIDPKKKISPKIAKSIRNALEPYRKSIAKANKHYELLNIGSQLERAELVISREILHKFYRQKERLNGIIYRKIEEINKKEGRMSSYSLNDLKALFERHKIGVKHYTTIFNAIYGKNIIRLDLEDIKIITYKAKKIKFYHLDVKGINKGDFEKTIKSNLKGMENAILMITGNKSTTLDGLCLIWDSAVKCLPRNAKIGFSYKVEEGSGLQIDVLAVK